MGCVCLPCVFWDEEDEWDELSERDEEEEKKKEKREKKKWESHCLLEKICGL